MTLMIQEGDTPRQEDKFGFKEVLSGDISNGDIIRTQEWCAERKPA